MSTQDVTAAKPPVMYGGYDAITWVGIGLALFSNALIAISLNIQKYAHNKNEALGSMRQPYHKIPIWWAGMVVNAFGELGNLIAYGYAEATVVTPIGAVGVVCSAIIATFILKEKFLKIHALGMSLIIAGVVLIVYSKGNEAVIEPTIEEALTEYFGSTQSIVYCISICSITVFLLFICETHGKSYVILYTSLCSLIASWTVLGCKSFMAFFRRTVEKGDNQLTRMPEGLFAWFTLLVVVACAVISLHYLQQAMRYHDNNKVIPTYYATFTLACIIGAAVVYKEFEGLTARQLSIFFVGLVLAGAGVFTISAKRAQEEKEQGEHEEKIHANGASRADTWDRWARNGDRLKLVEMDMLKTVQVENGDYSPGKFSPLHSNGS